MIEASTTLLGDIFRPSLAILLVLLPLTALEMAFGREDVSMATRLKGLPFQLVQLASFVIAGKVFINIFRDLGIEPVVDPFGFVGGAAVVVVVLLWKDFIAYWSHRIVHSYYLWPFHAPHHAPRYLSAINNHNHWTAPIFNLVIVAFPLAFVEQPEAAIWWVLALKKLHDGFTHSNVTFDMGPLKYLIVGPGFHRVHHSMEEEHFDKNFSAMFTVWDVLFGTVHWHDVKHRPPVGVADFPEPSFADWWFAPFTYWWNRLPGKPLHPAMKARASARGETYEFPEDVIVTVEPA